MAEIDGEQVYWWNSRLSGKISKDLELNDTSSLVAKAEQMFDMAEDQTLTESIREANSKKIFNEIFTTLLKEHILR